MIDYHVPVLLQEAIRELRIEKGGKYIDGTLGSGGYSLAIAQKGGEVLSFDVDSDAIAFAQDRIVSLAPEIRERIHIVNQNFRTLKATAEAFGFERVQGIVLDLGVSSHQLDTPERGFSFRSLGPLDMRMDRSLERSAADLVNTLSVGELIAIFMGFGQERFAKKLAEKIVATRPISSTDQLAGIAVDVYPKGFHKIHPATRMFQALRIAVNDELGALTDCLDQAVDLLSPGGRLVVVSFHSLEDEIVKKKMREFEAEKIGSMVTKKVIEPTDEEIARNVRARSSKMRIFEKRER